MNRRDFLYTLGAATTMAKTLMGFETASPASTKIKPISGSWFEFQHHATVEGVDWNPALAHFSCDQWQLKIKEIAETGMEYLVLMATALYFRSFYRTNIFPSWKLTCDDPLEAVLSAADKYNVRFFIGGGFYGQWDSADILADPAAAKKRLQAIEEITQRYGHHKSFFGWYWPNEAFIDRYFSDQFISYVNTCSRLARQLTPRSSIMIAPYGTRVAVPDDKYVHQLQSLDVDIIAYQDEVGVRKSKAEETSVFYEGLRKAHDRAGRAAIWADVEIFEFEGDVYKSALVPASFDRILRQMAAVSPWVDKILVYQNQGMMNKPNSPAFCGNSESERLYGEYVEWLRTQSKPGQDNAWGKSSALVRRNAKGKVRSTIT
ncbi:MAG TPA: DUF4434 domain-containing protein [Dongiaceae bacterium]|nr:DUF4434 domain-containing protein [Dongiaceae bacterium]